MIIGAFFVWHGMPWYATLKLPSYTPSGFFISSVWHVIFLLATIAILYLWNKTEHGLKFGLIMFLFGINGLLNSAWSYIFFYKHMIGTAVWCALSLALSTFLLIVMIWPISRFAASLLIPYALWVVFATYLNYMIWLIN